MLFDTSYATCRRRGAPLCFTALGLLALGGCPSGPQNQGAEPIFPANYRATYTLVRDCRNSIEHGATIRVWVNPIGAQAYLADENPLPVGTIVVKEEFVGVDCSDDNELEFWSAMRKEAAGFDSQDADWRWQEVGADRKVRLDDKSTCIDCHRDPDCIARDYMCTVP